MACLNVKHDNKVVVDRLDVKDYKLKNVAKSDAASKLIMTAMQQNNLFKRCKVRDILQLYTRELVI